MQILVTQLGDDGDIVDGVARHQQRSSAQRGSGSRERREGSRVEVGLIFLFLPNLFQILLFACFLPFFTNSGKMLPIRHILSAARRSVVSGRCMATSGPLVDMAVSEEGVATVTMQRPPVNSLNLDLLQAISSTLDDLTKNKARAMILTSASPTVFSAGLDIMEMYKPDPKRVDTFWRTLQDVWLKLFGSSFITAAAINGHAPAGGCLLACSCEYRVMVEGKFTIGLNETALGIVAPPWFQDSLKNTISVREAEMALTLGKLYPVADALKVGLIDETASDKADAIAKCQKFISKFERISPKARAASKMLYREHALNKLRKNKDADVQLFLGTVTQPKVQQGLEMYLAMLKQKSQK